MIAAAVERFGYALADAPEAFKERRRQIARHLPVVITTRRRSQASHAKSLQLGIDYASFIIRRDVQAAARRCHGLAAPSEVRKP